MNFGELIRKYRTDNKMSMDDFAQKSGISKAYISMLEKNKNLKTGKKIKPSFDVIQKCAKAMNIDVSTLINNLDDNQVIEFKNHSKRVKIKVLGRVQAGVPVEAIQDIIGEEEITEEMARTGKFFGLKIRGDSMSPRMEEGDVVIVRKQSTIETGETAIVLVNGEDATCKKIKKTNDGIMLIPFNNDYEPWFYTNEQIETLPVRIIGKVVELRAKF